MADARGKRLRMIAELFLESSSDEDDCEPPRRDAQGNVFRKGGWQPTPSQQPDATGKSRWMLDFTGSRLWTLLQRMETYVEDSYWGKYFRSRLGVPRTLFDTLVEECRACPEIKDHRAGDGSGIQAPSTVPLTLKLAMALNWLTQGGSLVSAADNAGMDPQTARRFVHRWAFAVFRMYYPQHVKVPSGEELVRTLQLHARMGFPGMLAGTDGVEVQVTGIPWAERDRHKGKGDSLTRGFNVSGSARRKVFHVEGSFDGGTNDKTKARYDRLMQALYTRTQYDDIVFELYTGYDGSRSLEAGLWLLTDNGYHYWRCVQFPSKHPTSADDMAWSARCESVRKPSSECIFGIIKKRFRLFGGVFDFGNRNSDAYRSTVRTFDCLFRIACMLHNRLQEHDGIADMGDLESDWRPVNVARDIERRMRRLQSEAAAGGSLPSMRHMFTEDADDTVQYEMDHDVLHQKLVTHYAVARHRGEVKWLRTAKASRGLGRDDRPLLPGHRRHAALYAAMADAAGVHGEAGANEPDDEPIYESEIDADADGDGEDDV